MAATVEILGWSARGLRCPDHEILCADGQDRTYGVTLVQMPNGTGKTTTLNLLRLALSGRWDKAAPAPAEIKKFQKKGGTEGVGAFEVVVRLNGKRVTIRMTFDFDTGRIRYRTTRNQGMVEGFDPPVEFRRFLNENFINFFVFDGELAEKLLDEDHTDAEAVVETLFQLNTLELMARKVSAYWDRRAEADSDPATEHSRARKVAKARSRLSYLESRQKALHKQNAELSAKLEAQERAYQTELSKSAEVARKVEDAKARMDQAESDVRAHALELLEEMRNPHALAEVFAHDMYELKTNLDRAKLPGTAAREFFQDLANETHCVCGEEITPVLSDRIRERSKLYLGSDEVGFLNAMKTDIDEVVGASRGAPARVLNGMVTTLDEQVRLDREARNAFDAFSEEAANADPAIARADEEIKDLKQRLKIVQDELDRFEEKDGNATIDQTWGVEVMRKRIDAYEKS